MSYSCKSPLQPSVQMCHPCATRVTMPDRVRALCLKAMCHPCTLKSCFPYYHFFLHEARKHLFRDTLQIQAFGNFSSESLGGSVFVRIFAIGFQSSIERGASGRLPLHKGHDRIKGDNFDA